MASGSARPDDAAEPHPAIGQPPEVAQPADATKPGPLQNESPNPFYALLLIFSTAFVLTGLVLALVPWPELPDWLKRYGWQLVIVEMVLVIITGLASMALDRWRSLRK